MRVTDDNQGIFSGDAGGIASIGRPQLAIYSYRNASAGAMRVALLAG